MTARNSSHAPGITRPPVRRGTAAALAALTACLALGVTACSGGGDSETSMDETSSGQVDGSGTDSGGDSLDMPPGAPAPASGERNGVADSALGAKGEAEGSGGGDAARVAVQTRRVISTGSVTLVAKDLTTVRSEIDRLVGRYGGFVADEFTRNNDKGETTTSTLSLRVPSRSFDKVLDGFDEFATVTSAKRTSEDVTTEVIDVDQRIRTQEVSLARLRKFLGRATSVATILSYESEIARREADLASLRAQQRYLDDQTTLATITVDMHLKDGTEPKKEKVEDQGFLTGLDAGWDALVAVLLVTGTVLGALTPFAIVALLLGLPLAILLRRLSAARSRARTRSAA